MTEKMKPNVGVLYGLEVANQEMGKSIKVCPGEAIICEFGNPNGIFYALEERIIFPIDLEVGVKYFVVIRKNNISWKTRLNIVEESDIQNSEEHSELLFDLSLAQLAKYKNGKIKIKDVRKFKDISDLSYEQRDTLELFRSPP